MGSNSQATPVPSLHAFWWRYVRLPLVLLVVGVALITATSLDTVLARALFFDGTRWVGAQSWWTNELLHDGGRWVTRLVAVAALSLWGLSAFVKRYADLRRPASFVAIAIILSTGLVGLLKSQTNVDCPSDLAGFGGSRPYVGLLEDRPDDLPHAACFPAAHSSSGFALVAFYFLWRERNRRRARASLALGLVTGMVFGIAQQSRGAHFISHDVWSAFLVWTISLTVYVYGFRCRVWGAMASAMPLGNAQTVPS
jgi:membrane-associated PAP2 superfamily phosphatase